MSVLAVSVSNAARIANAHRCMAFNARSSRSVAMPANTASSGEVFSPVLLGSNPGSLAKFIPDTLYRGEQAISEFASELSNVHIDGAVAHNHVIAPYRGQNGLSGENLARF